MPNIHLILMETSKYFNLLKKTESGWVYQNEDVRHFKFCIKDFAKSVDINIDILEDQISYKLDTLPEASDKLILYILELPGISDKLKDYLSGSVSISRFFSKLDQPIYFGDILDIFDELMYRGLHFDFNECNNSDKNIVAIDADDRIKFIPYKKYKFEDDLNNLLADIILEKQIKDDELIDFVNTKIKNYIIGKQTFEVLDNDLSTYSHMIDYLYSDSFNNEIGLKGLHGCSFEVIQNNVRIWTAAFSKQKVKDNLSGRVLVFNSYGYDWYQLKSADSLDYESAIMGHCVGQGSYDKRVEGNEIEIYSLRDEANQPHVTIEINKGEIRQIKGKANRQILEKYRKSTIDFIVKYLNIEVQNIPDSIKHYILLSGGKNPIPLIFKDIEYLTYYLVGQSSMNMENLIYELVKDESALFKYNIDEVCQQMIKLVSGKIGKIDGVDGFIDLENYKYIRMHIIPAIPAQMDLQIFAKLYKISTLSELRQWSMDVLRPLLKKSKYKNYAKELLNLAEAVGIVMGLSLADLLSRLFDDEMEIYQKAKNNAILEFISLDDSMKTIKDIQRLGEEASYPTSKDFRNNNFTIPEIGCDDCSNDKLLDELKSHQGYMESSISGLEDIADQISSFIDFGVNLVGDMETFLNELSNSITVDDLLVGIDSKFNNGYNYKLEEQFKYLNEKAKSITNLFEEDAWCSWAKRGIKFKDYDEIISSYEKSIKTLQGEKKDFDGVSLESCDNCNPRGNNQDCSISDSLLAVDDTVIRFFSEMDAIKQYANPKLLRIAESVSDYVRKGICSVLFTE